MIISSPKTIVKISDTKLFALAGNCKNFSQYIPEEVKDFCTTEDSCSFTIENISRITLTILERIPYSYICYKADNDKNIPLYIKIKLESVSENETNLEIELNLEVPVFLKPLIQKPLQRFVEELSKKIKLNTETII